LSIYLPQSLPTDAQDIKRYRPILYDSTSTLDQFGCIRIDTGLKSMSQ
jgi:hypothetical protein